MPCLLQGNGEAGRTSRDEQTIANDVARCLHESQVDVGSQDRDELRVALTRLLKAVVDGKKVYYYQVCAVAVAYVLCTLVHCATGAKFCF
jgi:hypothetical protein